MNVGQSLPKPKCHLLPPIPIRPTYRLKGTPTKTSQKIYQSIQPSTPPLENTEYYQGYLKVRRKGELKKLTSNDPSLILCDKIHNKNTPQKAYSSLQKHRPWLPKNMPQRMVYIIPSNNSQSITIQFWHPQKEKFHTLHYPYNSFHEELSKILHEIDQSTNNLIEEYKNKLSSHVDFRVNNSNDGTEVLISNNDFQNKPDDHLIFVYDTSQADHPKSVYFKDPNTNTIKGVFIGAEKRPSCDRLESCLLDIKELKAQIRFFPYQKDWTKQGYFINKVLDDHQEVPQGAPYPPVKIFLTRRQYKNLLYLVIYPFDISQGSYTKPCVYKKLHHCDFPDINKTISVNDNWVSYQCEMEQDNLKISQKFLNKKPDQETIERLKADLTGTLSWRFYIGDFPSELRFLFVSPLTNELINLALPIEKFILENLFSSLKYLTNNKKEIETDIGQHQVHHHFNGDPNEIVLSPPYTQNQDNIGLLWSLKNKSIKVFIRDPTDDANAIVKACYPKDLKYTIEVVKAIRNRKKSDEYLPTTPDQLLGVYSNVAPERLMEIWNYFERCRTFSIPEKIPPKKNKATKIHKKLGSPCSFFTFNQKRIAILSNQDFIRRNAPKSSFKTRHIAFLINQFPQTVFSTPYAWMTCTYFKERYKFNCNIEAEILMKIRDQQLDRYYLVNSLFVTIYPSKNNHYFTNDKGQRELKKINKCGFMLEYCDAGPFTYENLNELNCDLKTRIELFKQAAIALRKLHQLGYRHGDIKEDNLMLKTVNKELEIRLLDFGLSRKIDYQSNGLTGTLHYLAPECHTNNEQSIKSDIYALGFVGFRALLNLSSDLSECSSLNGFYKVIYQPKESFSDLPQELCEEFILFYLINRMMATDPTTRPTLNTVLYLLDHLLEDEQKIDQTNKVIKSLQKQ